MHVVFFIFSYNGRKYNVRAMWILAQILKLHYLFFFHSRQDLQSLDGDQWWAHYIKKHRLNCYFGKTHSWLSNTLASGFITCLLHLWSTEWLECVLTCPALAAWSMKSSGCLCVWPLVAPDCRAASAVWCAWEKRQSEWVNLNYRP